MKGISGFYRHQWQVLLVCLFFATGDNASVIDVWCDVGFDSNDY